MPCERDKLRNIARLRDATSAPDLAGPLFDGVGDRAVNADEGEK
jgi:hypothetical protein